MRKKALSAEQRMDRSVRRINRYGLAAQIVTGVFVVAMLLVVCVILVVLAHIPLTWP